MGLPASAPSAPGLLANAGWRRGNSPASRPRPLTLTPPLAAVSGTCSEQQPQEGRAHGWVLPALSLSLC